MKYHLKIKIRRYRFKLICSLAIVLTLTFYFFGIFTHLFEEDYATHFQYPIYSPNFRYLIETVKSNLYSRELTPLNNFTFAYHHSPVGKCATNEGHLPPDPLTLLIVVKSAVCNYQLRAAIRQSWGNEKRFSDVNIRTVFMLGLCTSQAKTYSEYSATGQQCTLSTPSSHLYSAKAFSWLPVNASTVSTIDCQQLVDAEYAAHGDLVQAEFIDSYYNNTLKTMATLHWTVKHCSKVPFMLFVDDDFYVSVKNLLKFTRNFLQRANHEGDAGDPELNESVQFDGRLYTGYVFPYSRPMRHLSSKWYISLADYPYSRYPPYITGGCFLLNNRTASDLHYASLYTKKFKYDDVYLGILAHKMDINLVHNGHIYFYKYAYDADEYKSVIASHGYTEPDELISVWSEQKLMGNA